MDNVKKISVFLDRIEEDEDGSAEAIFVLEEEKDEFREFVLPADFLPEGTNEGEYLTLQISRDEEKTKDALDAARALLKKLEE
ncbi:MAG: DUF3006 family protein [Selenomonadaceae bacterium]|nr:DUF3006 family protein [Selenomonadaceae bacterium]